MAQRPSRTGRAIRRSHRGKPEFRPIAAFDYELATLNVGECQRINGLKMVDVSGYTISWGHLITDSPGQPLPPVAWSSSRRGVARASLPSNSHMLSNWPARNNTTSFPNTGAARRIVSVWQRAFNQNVMVPGQSGKDNLPFSP